MLKNLANAHMRKFYAISFIASLFANTAYGCEPLVFADAWIREPPPVSRVAAGYVSITNSSDNDYVINRFESDCCTTIMAHETVAEDAKTKMKHLSKITIAAKQTVKLEPLGKHLMLVKPAQALTDGQQINISFFCGKDDVSHVAFQVVKR